MTGSQVWCTWTKDDPEPAGVTVVRDNSGVVSYTDSPEWKREWGRPLWWGWKGGLKVGLEWPVLLERHGPVAGKCATTAQPEPELVEPAPAANPWLWWTSGIAS